MVRCRAAQLAALACLLLLMACSAPPLRHTPMRPPTTQSVVHAAASGLSAPVDDPDLQAVVVPPVGWIQQPPKIDSRHAHRIWLSPSGDVAYGVIHFSLPLPLGPSITLSGFLQEMKKTEGDATLISRADDEKLPGIRFVADGGLYRIRANLLTSGFDGWVIYAGTLRSQPLNAPELALGIAAREQTQIAD
jgi:hypothetical protein